MFDLISEIVVANNEWLIKSFGSGYILTDETTTPNSVVVVEVQFQHCLVINVRLRK